MFGWRTTADGVVVVVVADVVVFLAKPAVLSIAVDVSALLRLHEVESESASVNKSPAALLRVIAAVIAIIIIFIVDLSIPRQSLNL